MEVGKEEVVQEVEVGKEEVLEIVAVCCSDTCVSSVDKV